MSAVCALGVRSGFGARCAEKNCTRGHPIFSNVWVLIQGTWRLPR